MQFRFVRQQWDAHYMDAEFIQAASLNERVVLPDADEKYTSALTCSEPPARGFCRDDTRTRIRHLR